MVDIISYTKIWNKKDGTKSKQFYWKKTEITLNNKLFVICHYKQLKNKKDCLLGYEQSFFILLGDEMYIFVSHLHQVKKCLFPNNEKMNLILINNCKVVKISFWG